MSKKNSIVKEIISMLICFIVAIICAYIIVTYVFRITIVSGDSMNNTLISGETLYVDKIAFRFSDPKRGDIVILHYPIINDEFSSESYIKRVVGMPGETISIKDGIVYINGESGLDKWAGNHIMKDMEPVYIPKDCYFVMGDNRSNSKDSRTVTVGPIPRKQIIGRPVFRFYPFSEFGKIDYIY